MVEFLRGVDAAELSQLPLASRVASWDYELDQGLAPALVVVPVGVDYVYPDDGVADRKPTGTAWRVLTVEVVVVSPEAGSGQAAVGEAAVHYLAAIEAAIDQCNLALQRGTIEDPPFPLGLALETGRTAYHEAYRNLAEAEAPEASLRVSTRARPRR